MGSLPHRQRCQLEGYSLVPVYTTVDKGKISLPPCRVIVTALGGHPWILHVWQGSHTGAQWIHLSDTARGPRGSPKLDWLSHHRCPCCRERHLGLKCDGTCRSRRRSCTSRCCSFVQCGKWSGRPPRTWVGLCLGKRTLSDLCSPIFQFTTRSDLVLWM